MVRLSRKVLLLFAIFASHYNDDVDALNLVLIQLEALGTWSEATTASKQVGFSFIIYVCMYLSDCFSFCVIFFSSQILEGKKL